jgi:hypothetical protein
VRNHLKGQALKSTSIDDEDLDDEELIASSEPPPRDNLSHEEILRQGPLRYRDGDEGAWRQAHAQLTSWGNLRLYDARTGQSDSAREHAAHDVVPLSGCRIFVPKINRPEEPCADAQRARARRAYRGVSPRRPSVHVVAVVACACTLSSWHGGFAARRRYAFRVQLDSSGASATPKKLYLSPSSSDEADGWRNDILRYAAPATSGGGGGKSKKKRVLVLGSSGSLAQATLYWLVEKYGESLEVQAGTRAPPPRSRPPGRACSQYPAVRCLLVHMVGGQPPREPRGQLARY